MARKNSGKTTRAIRHSRVRAKISGTPERPRLIDDVNGVTLVSASSNAKDFDVSGSNKEGARKLGNIIAEKAKDKGITKVVFDRSGYVYHGRIQELAEGARESGLEF